MSYLSGVALRKFQQKYFGSIKRLVYSNGDRKRIASDKAHHDKEKYDTMLKQLDAERRHRLKHGDRQFKVFIFLLTLLPILAFIIACLR